MIALNSLPGNQSIIFNRGLLPQLSMALTAWTVEAILQLHVVVLLLRGREVTASF